jgi:glycosyltransferase involved in cell wall biosynthesis
MMLMGRGIPIVASVRPDSEVARIVSESGGGWVVDASDPRATVELARAVAGDRAELQERGRCAWAFAAEHFDPERIARRFDDLLTSL